jgi:hypothetical protein
MFLFLSFFLYLSYLFFFFFSLFPSHKIPIIDKDIKETILAFPAAGARAGGDENQANHHVGTA